MSFNFLSYKAKVYPRLIDFFTYCDNADTVIPGARYVAPLFYILKRPLAINPRLSGVIDTRKAALQCFDWTIVADDDAPANIDPEAIEDRCKTAIDEILDRQLDQVLYGKLLIEFDAITNQNGSASENVVNVKKIYEPYEFDVFNQAVNLFDPNVINNYPYIPPTIGTPIDKSKLILCRFNKSDPAGGLMRSIALLEILRYDMLLENANYLKKLKGILQVINKGASNEEQAEAEDAAANAIRDNYLITSDNLELKLNQLTATGGAGFKEYMDMLQNEETIAVLGQANTTQLPKSGGSRAALQVQKMISADIFYKDMIRVEKLMNDYLLLDYRLNYDANASLSRMPYQFRFNLEEEQDIEKNAIAIREVLNSGISLKKSEVYQKLGFSVPGKDDDIIASPAIATTSI